MPAHFLDDLARRDHACALALYAVNGDAGRGVGDPVHEEVTEGRRRQYETALKAGQAWALTLQRTGGGYHSCGDLAAWVLYRLGCRDERLVNRTDDGGIRAWQPGRNVAAINGSRYYTKAGRGAVPDRGDILFLLKNGGHLAVLIEWDDAGGTVTSADYGQPYGRKRVRKLRQDGRGGWTLDGSALDGWLDLGAVEMGAEPDLSGVAS